MPGYSVTVNWRVNGVYDISAALDDVSDSVTSSFVKYWCRHSVAVSTLLEVGRRHGTVFVRTETISDKTLRTCVEAYLRVGEVVYDSSLMLWALIAKK
jgi:hypothetical protein